MIGRLTAGFVVIAVSGLAANLPRFAFTSANGGSFPTAITTNSLGNTYLTGSVTGSPLTATPGSFQSQNASGNTCIAGGGIGPPNFFALCRNAFVIKLDPSGNVVFLTYLGGTGDAAPAAIALDSSGNVYVAGTGSVTSEAATIWIR